ncbi:MAG: hypothetical protein KGL39_44755 [Patescibacteria group bacterium]|nr:hypothetical protein [Patescibacteria group bacterium]
MAMAKWKLPRGKRQVPEEFQQDFDEFMASKTPTDLAEEIALLRTLYLEARAARDHAGTKTIYFAHSALKDSLELNEEGAEKALKILEKFFLPTPLSLDEAVKLSGILKEVVKAAETMTKISEGFSLKVDINERVLIKFLQVCVLPYLDRAQRAAVADRAQRFSISRALAEVPEALSASYVDTTAREVPQVEAE